MLVCLVDWVYDVFFFLSNFLFKKEYDIKKVIFVYDLNVLLLKYNV